MAEDDSKNALVRKLTDFLESAFEAVWSSRKAHYANKPGERPQAHEVEQIIARYANQNAIVAGAASLVPGPFGAAAILPEIVFVLRNQIQMTYDICVAYGQEERLTPNALLAIFATVAGGGAIGLATVKGGQFVVKQASLKVIQQVIHWLGGKITQRVLKAFLAKWLPVVGAGGMALWALHTTRSMGREAATLLANGFTYEGDEPLDA